jgi:hypothetical protein
MAMYREMDMRFGLEYGGTSDEEPAVEPTPRVKSG